MDKPLAKTDEQIPEGQKYKYEEEIRKFKKYKLDDDVEFSKFLKKELSSKKPELYVQDLYSIVAALASQDKLMHLLNRSNLSQTYFKELQDLIIKNIDEAHEDAAIIFEISKWLNTNYRIMLARRNLYLKEAVDLAQQLVPLFFNPKFNNLKSQLYKANSFYITRYIDTLKKREEAGDRFEKRYGSNFELRATPAFKAEFEEETNKIASLYQSVRKYYVLFYEKILKEINETLRKNNIQPLAAIKDLPLKFENYGEFMTAETMYPFAEFKALIKKAKEKNIQPLPQLPSASQPKIIKQSPLDDSYILEGDEDESHAIIQNKKNKTTEEIIKKNGSNKIPKFNLKYTKNVLEWLDNPKDAIKSQGYQVPGHKNYTSEHLQQMMIERHAFSRFIDDFIPDAGIQSTIPNRRNKDQQDILISIPGKITYSDRSQETGYFSYIIDARNNECYHRIFDPSSSKKMAEQLLAGGNLTPQNPTLYEVMFPTLSKP